MSLPIVFRRAAQCEFIEAAEWRAVLEKPRDPVRPKRGR
jgi:hypothetical protein